MNMGDIDAAVPADGGRRKVQVVPSGDFGEIAPEDEAPEEEEEEFDLT